MALLQESQHNESFDYEGGSPHLRHSRLRGAIVDRIRGLVLEQFGRRKRVRVLELGAGHGAFTDHVLATGASVVVSEMSRPSVAVLETRYANNPLVQVVYDSDGEEIFRRGLEFDVVLCISVLHHIPDYIGAVGRLIGMTARGGSFASFQDPLWYPRRSRANLLADRASYFAWRLGRGNLIAGAATRLRRLRGSYDESNPADMVEYHVVRQGCDEEALSELLAPHFDDVEMWRYWSTQSAVLQRLGTRFAAPTTFGLSARGHRLR